MTLTRELRSQIRSKREPTVLFEGRMLPESIPLLMELIAAAGDAIDQDDLMGELAGEHGWRLVRCTR